MYLVLAHLFVEVPRPGAFTASNQAATCY